MFIDYFVDGHFISAQNVEDAVSACESVYGFTPDTVREWTTEDQEELDFQTT